MAAAVLLAAENRFASEELRLERGCSVAPANPLTPLMGWSSWNTFAEHISEDIILGVAQAMATNGLKDAGYVYVNIDDGFFNGHGPDGRLRFNPTRFPNGMKGTVGIIGPRRMDYERVVDVLRHMMEQLDDLYKQ